MEKISTLQQYAREVEDHFLEEIANKNVLNYTIDINYDDRKIDAYYILNRPIKWITCTVVLKRSI